MTSAVGKLWYLKKIDVFSEMSDEEMEELSDLTHVQDVPEGQSLYFPGDNSDTIFMLKKGRVQISRTDPEGQQITLAVIEPGEIFGEMALTGDKERQSRAETLQNSFLCAISRERFLNFLEDHPELNFRLTKLIGERRREVEEKIEQLLFCDAGTRLALVLQDLFENHAEPGDGEAHPKIEFSHQELADLTGQTRPTVTTYLNELQKEGILDIGRKALELKDPSGLERRVAKS